MRIRPGSSASRRTAVQLAVGLAVGLTVGLAVGLAVAGTSSGHEPAGSRTAVGTPAIPAQPRQPTRQPTQQPPLQAPLKPTLHSIPLGSDGSSAPRVPARHTPRFSLLGVTWADGVGRMRGGTSPIWVTSFRQSVWTRSGLTAKRHTVTVVIVATRTRPTVITDGIVYLSAK